MQENNIAANGRIVRFAACGRVAVRLLEYGSDNLIFGPPWLPVIGIDLGSHCDVSLVLYVFNRANLLGDVRLLIDGIGRPEVEWLYANLACEQPLRHVQFEINIALRDFADIRMAESVVANRAAFVINP